MNIKYTELYTLAEIDEAIMEGKVVEFLAKTGQWVRAYKHNGQAMHRYRLVEEVEAVKSYGPFFSEIFGLNLPIKDGDSLTAKTLRYKGADIFRWQRRAASYLKSMECLNKLIKERDESIKERDELIRLLYSSINKVDVNIQEAGIATKKLPQFGDKILVWNSMHKHRCKFVCFSDGGRPMVLNISGTNLCPYNHWAWPDESKDD